MNSNCQTLLSSEASFIFGKRGVVLKRKCIKDSNTHFLKSVDKLKKTRKYKIQKKMFGQFCPWTVFSQINQVAEELKYLYNNVAFVVILPLLFLHL